MKAKTKYRNRRKIANLSSLQKNFQKTKRKVLSLEVERK